MAPAVEMGRVFDELITDKWSRQFYDGKGEFVLPKYHKEILKKTEASAKIIKRIEEAVKEIWLKKHELEDCNQIDELKVEAQVVLKFMILFSNKEWLSGGGVIVMVADSDQKPAQYLVVEDRSSGNLEFYPAGEWPEGGIRITPVDENGCSLLGLEECQSLESEIILDPGEATIISLTDSRQPDWGWHPSLELVSLNNFPQLFRPKDLMISEEELREAFNKQEERAKCEALLAMASGCYETADEFDTLMRSLFSTISSEIQDSPQIE
ncbi:MAG: hypothetical protein GF381_00590 [Candidatus Pacebacteria bacterium]|nr:hypothetical protein [Candidatus Paceibacterota bacterium]